MIETILVFVAAALLGVGPEQASQATKTDAGHADLALVGATLYPAPDAPPIRNAVVIVRNGTIDAVGSRPAIAPPAGMPVLDLRGRTLVAGFWNSHVHFKAPRFGDAGTAPAARLAAEVRGMIVSRGFTTVFDTGSVLRNTLALKRRIDAGEIDGPTIFTTGEVLYPPGAPDAPFPMGTAAEAMAATRALIDGGADAIKVYAQTFWDLTLKLSPEVLAAVRAETSRRKVQMFAHPSNRDGLLNAIASGVDVLVHTTPQIGPWGSELVAKMKAANIAVIPTLKLWRFELLKDQAPEDAILRFQRRGVEQLREYVAAGGPVLFGTDVGYMTDDSTLEEFQQMALAGMGFRDILASLTTVPAARRGLQSRTGRVAAGFDADLVVLGADPAENVAAFADVAYTIKKGRIVYRD